MRQNPWQVALSCTSLIQLLMAVGYHGPMRHHPKPSVLAIFCVLRWALGCICECAMVPSTQILQSHDTFGKGEACTVTGAQMLAKDCCQGAVSGRMEPFAVTVRATASAPELTLGRGSEWVHQSEKL